MNKKPEQKYPHIHEMIRKHAAELEQRKIAVLQRHLRAAASVLRVNRHA